ncbi:hypothetical protein DEH67_12250 [Salmonella enterica]|uniref:hypothetical protein n=1 Tax=Enterobacteriaceae TaxID=543 RepID=UPI000B91C2A0|nr:MULTISPECIES: hypothetical protein [Enterobacteriaceae]EAA8828429.1 hypothetical protein [Salmonella enterica subsp. enterica serovar Javiana]EAM8918892.1 hypothetical protein [Salmonella enterica]EBS0922508.1 hypothetical protein [Salmonella enterica subsp. enterica serovar Enteritidis]EBW6383719.1 hypothetical protein [Salmonella enterica subsp. enterica serovar Stanley]EBW9303719.1 hypothetical protein [Salmonella enterica subsp. enterica serovar Bovismorbificans]EEA6788935.1 hypothetic
MQAANSLCWFGVDPARDDTSITVWAVVERVFDRWKLHDFWLVEFEAFDVCEGVHVRNTFLFDTAREAFKFKPGRAVSWRESGHDFDDDLPF